MKKKTRNQILFAIIGIIVILVVVFGMREYGLVKFEQYSGNYDNYQNQKEIIYASSTTCSTDTDCYSQLSSVLKPGVTINDVLTHYNILCENNICVLKEK